MKVGFLGSGSLGAKVLEFVKNEFPIEFILTDSKSSEVIKSGTEEGIPLFKGNPRKGDIDDFLKDKKPEVIFSVNYIFLIDKRIIQLPRKYAFNIHGSLLPKYRGRAPHIWAIINNENVTGITVHQIDEGCDTGDIVLQKKLEIESELTGAQLLRKFNDSYPNIVMEVLRNAQNDQLSFEKQDHEKGTYFGKRNPEDGTVDWNWHRERIFNWVRALSPPYPGAFTYHEGKKLYVHWVEFSDLGFDFKDPNGKVLKRSKDQIFVKTPNGTLEIKDYYLESYQKVEKGAILG